MAQNSAAEILDDEDVAEGGDDEVTTKRKKKKFKPLSQQEIDLALDAAEKLRDIGDELGSRLFERDAVIRDILVALVAKENVLLIGPPGTAKTKAGELLAQAIKDAEVFKWLMNRTTDPSEIIGPFSIPMLQQERFVRITTGKLPEAHIAILDEIFKSNEAALNYLLPIMNEGYFYNDGKQVPVSRRFAIGMSNEVPEGEELQAFFDRFIFRHWVDYLKDANNRVAMSVLARDEANPNTRKFRMKNKVTLEQIDILQRVVNAVEFPTTVGDHYDRLVRTLNTTHGIAISDRRYYKGQVAMMAHALLCGRMRVTTKDFAAITYVLGNSREHIEFVEKETSKFANPYENECKELHKKAKEAFDNLMNEQNPATRAAQAVTVNATINDILMKVEQQVKLAKADGENLTKLEKLMKEVEGYSQDINTNVLRTQKRSNKGW